jgi:large subunit ribosomal protein L23
MSEFHYADVLLGPVITEKSNDLMIEMNKYVFAISLRATKNDVKRAVAERFDVKVKDVNIVTLPRKPKRAGMRKYQTKVRRKAVVTLVEGELIPELSEAV